MLHNGKIIGGCVALAALMLSGAADARDFSVLYSGSTSEITGVALDESGALYVTSYGGGKHQAGFLTQLDPSGSATPLYQFESRHGPSFPTTHLWRDASGDLYGVASRLDGPNNFGTAVYKISNGVETTLHFFGEGNGDLGGPRAGLTPDGAGNLYGATCTAGANGLGNVFKVAADGTVTTLHDFNGTDGNCPMADLTFDAKGNLLGTTFIGGSDNGGTVFRISAKGHFSILHDFIRMNDGSQLWSGVTLDEHGNMYGAASNLGPGGNGTAWKLAPNGTFTLLHVFHDPSDGELPFGTLMRDAKGTFYGVTIQGGSIDNKGTLFSLTPGGKFRVLHSFMADEGAPACQFVIDASGNLFGSTIGGGEHGWGIVYEMGK